MIVLVTGANGLLATNTIKHLLEKGYNVKALIRDKRKFSLAAHPLLDLIKGDILDKKSVENAVKNCDYVVHIAALTAQHISDYKPYYEVNVKGTLHIIEASLKYKIKRIIYISTANTRGYGSPTNLGHEDRLIQKPYTSSNYARSKLEAEKEVLAVSDKIDVVLLNPTFMIGPYDAKPSSGRIILMGHKKIIFYPPGGKNFVNVTDAAKAVSAAIDKGKNGETYILAGENLSYKQFFEMIRSKTNSKSILVKLPKSVLIATGYIGDFLRKTGVNTAVSSTNMKILCIKNYYSHQKAEKELNLKFESIETGINAAIQWFRKNGKIT